MFKNFITATLIATATPLMAQDTTQRLYFSLQPTYRYQLTEQNQQVPKKIHIYDFNEETIGMYRIKSIYVDILTENNNSLTSYFYIHFSRNENTTLPNTNVIFGTTWDFEVNTTGNLEIEMSNGYGNTTTDEIFDNRTNYEYLYSFADTLSNLPKMNYTDQDITALSGQVNEYTMPANNYENTPNEFSMYWLVDTHLDNQYTKRTYLDELRIQYYIYTPTVEVVDIPNLMFTVLGMPFSFISQAFNLTLFPNTAYAINVSNILFALATALIAIYIIRRFTR